MEGFKTQCEELGVKAEFAVPQTGRIEEQVEIMEGLMARKVDAISLCPLDPDALTPSINKAMEKGIPVIFGGFTDAPRSKGLCYISPDNYLEVGYAQGHIAATLLPGQKGKVAYQVSQLTSWNMHRAIEGFQDALASYPDIEIVSIDANDDDFELALRHAENVLTRFPDIAAYCSACSAGGFINQAVVKAGKGDKIIQVHRTATPNLLDGIRKGTVYGSRHDNCYAYGYMGARGLYHAVNGKKLTLSYQEFGQKFFVAFTMITKENVDDFFEAQKRMTVETYVPKFDKLWE
jgi:ribose transport system substrate-binding protein